MSENGTAFPRCAAQRPSLCGGAASFIRSADIGRAAGQLSLHEFGSSSTAHSRISPCMRMAEQPPAVRSCNRRCALKQHVLNEVRNHLQRAGEACSSRGLPPFVELRAARPSRTREPRGRQSSLSSTRSDITRPAFITPYTGKTAMRTISSAAAGTKRVGVDAANCSLLSTPWGSGWDRPHHPRRW